MATLAFLFAPEREIPEEGDQAWKARASSWISMTADAWSERVLDIPKAERNGLPSDLLYCNVTTNAANFTERSNPELQEAAARWVDQVIRTWSPAGTQAPLPAIGPLAFAEATGTPSRISIQDLIAYRGTFTKIPKGKLKRGGQAAFLTSKGDPLEFELGPGKVEHTVFLEIVRAWGGEALAAWTYGRAFHLLPVRGRKGENGVPEQFGPFSFRLVAPSGGRRVEQLLAELKTSFEGSSLRPDWELLEKELRAPEASVEALFLAFGLPGAQEIIPRDAPKLWDALEQVAGGVLRGEEVAKEAVKLVNSFLLQAGREDVLKAKAGKPAPPAGVRSVAVAVRTFEETLGEAFSGAWRERRRAARLYWDISDGDGADHLRTGRDKAGFGASASLVSLLSCYPAEVRRDPLFYALAMLECEAANGHAFVEPLAKMAGVAPTAECVAVLYPASLQVKFYRDFGIGRETVKAGEAWEGEAFVDSPALVRGDLGKKLGEWFAARKCDGLVARLSPQSECVLQVYRSGEAADGGVEALGLVQPDPETVRAAGMFLEPRRIFAALGLPHILQPGEWQEGSYSGASRGAGDGVAQKSHALEALAALPSAVTVTSSAEIARLHPAGFRYLGPKDNMADGITSLCVTVPSASPDYLRLLRLDLAGLIGTYGAVWLEEDMVYAFSRTLVPSSALVLVLGDLPPGSTVAISEAGERKHVYVIG